MSTSYLPKTREFPRPLLFVVTTRTECMEGEEHRPPSSLEIALQATQHDYPHLRTLYLDPAHARKSDIGEAVTQARANLPDGAEIVTVGYDAGQLLEQADIPNFPMVNPMTDSRVDHDDALLFHVVASLGRIASGKPPSVKWSQHSLNITLPKMDPRGPDYHLQESYLRAMGFSSETLPRMQPSEDLPLSLEPMRNIGVHPDADIGRRRPFTREHIVTSDSAGLDAMGHRDGVISEAHRDKLAWRKAGHAAEDKPKSLLPIPVLANHRFLYYINPVGDEPPAHVHVYDRQTKKAARLAIIENPGIDNQPARVPFDVVPYFYTAQLTAAPVPTAPRGLSAAAILIDEGWPQKLHREKFNMAYHDLREARMFASRHAVALLDAWGAVHGKRSPVVNPKPDQRISHLGLDKEPIFAPKVQGLHLSPPSREGGHAEAMAQRAAAGNATRQK